MSLKNLHSSYWQIFSLQLYIIFHSFWKFYRQYCMSFIISFWIHVCIPSSTSKVPVLTAIKLTLWTVTGIIYDMSPIVIKVIIFYWIFFYLWSLVYMIISISAVYWRPIIVNQWILFMNIIDQRSDFSKFYQSISYQW